MPPLRFTPGKAIQTPEEGIRITPVPDRGPHVMHDIVQKRNERSLVSPKIRSKCTVLPPLTQSSDEDTDSSYGLPRTLSLDKLQLQNNAQGNFRDSI